ncbi:uncharacterized mitochondrial protein-like protein [Tanacetum coccineum]
MVGSTSQAQAAKETSLTFQCPLLTSTNYSIWRMRMEVLLGIQGVWDVVDPGSDDAKKNNIVKGLLFQSIPEDLILQIRNLKTRKEMWEAIKTRNLGVDRVKEARLQTLITEFENLKMSDNDTIDAYAAKFSGIASKSATLGKVMSEHKLVKNFLTSLPRRFVHIVAALEHVLDPKTTGFEDVTEYSNENSDSSRRRGRGSDSRGRGHGQGSRRGNTQNHGQCDSSKNREENEQKGKQHEKRELSHIKCYRCDQYGHFVTRCPERNRNHQVNLNETHEEDVYREEGTFFMINHIQETIFINEEKYTPPKSESNSDEDDVWYFDNGTSNHMTDSCGDLLIKVPRSANRLYKTQLKVGKEDTNEAGKKHAYSMDTTTLELPRDIANIPRVTVHAPVTNEQESDIDFDDLFASIARLETILIALAVGKGWKIHHLDVKTVFLNGDRKKLDSTLKEIGFLQCVQEKAVYRKLRSFNEFKRRMASQFEMSDLGELTYYLGIEVSQGNDCVEIKQERYAMKIFKEAGMEDCNATSCPMKPGLKLSKTKDEPKVKATQYRKMVSCLHYLLHTRPDLTYSVGVVSRYMQSPRKSHACAINQIICYLKGTTSLGIEYKRGKYKRGNDLVGYSRHNVDIDDGWSTTGHVFYLDTAPITWCSQKQTTVALSSCEAEFMAATTAACQAIWLRGYWRK